MPYEYNIPTGYAEEEVKGVIAESIASRLEFAQRRLSAYQASCATFERRYGMSTQEFLEKFESAWWPICVERLGTSAIRQVSRCDLPSQRPWQECAAATVRRRLSHGVFVPTSRSYSCTR